MLGWYNLVGKTKQRSKTRNSYKIAINKLSIDTRIKLNKYSLLLFIDKGNVPKKKDNGQTTSNFRPISLTAIFSQSVSH